MMNWSDIGLNVTSVNLSWRHIGIYFRVQNLYFLFGSFPYISLDKPPLLWHQQWCYIICDVSVVTSCRYITGQEEEEKEQIKWRFKT